MSNFVVIDEDSNSSLNSLKDLLDILHTVEDSSDSDIESVIEFFPRAISLSDDTDHSSIASQEISN